MADKSNSRLFYEISKIITEIYFSNLRFKLKNDCVCRVIADRFKQVSSVSILLYESNWDSLVNFGHYLNPSRSKARFGVKAKNYEKIMKNMALFEYFATNYEAGSLEDCKFDNYGAFDYFKSKNANYDQSSFNKFKETFITNGEYQVYLSYKRTISQQDHYSLKEPETLSGKYFYDLALGNLDKSNSIYTASANITKRNKTLNNLYKHELSINVGYHYHYFALPLHVNNRVIGIIRFLSHPNKMENDENPEKKILPTIEKKWPSVIIETELRELADMISLHIGNDYSAYEFKKLPLNKFANFFGYAKLLGAIMNSRACIIRASVDKFSKPKLLGWTDSINDYIRQLNHENIDHFAKNHTSLTELFKPIKYQRTDLESKIIAIQFNVNEDGISNIFYLYFSSNEIVRMTNFYNLIKEGQSNLEEIFDSNILSKLRNTNITQVMIVKIPIIENGYITFANTKFRSFTANDIDIIYPYINRLGSELYVRQSLPLESKAELLGNILHELQTPYELAREKANQLNKTIDEMLNMDFDQVIIRVKKLFDDYKSNKSRLPKIFEYLLNFIDSQLRLHRLNSNFDRISDYRPLNRLQSYSMFDEVEMLVFAFREKAHKEKGIYIIQDFSPKTQSPMVVHNTELFLGLFMSLMNNALQYSFAKDKQMKFVKGFDEDYTKETDGHIRVNCFSNSTNYGYSITNWGKIIPPEYVTEIFEYRVRGPIDFNIESEDNPIHGDGIGLFQARKFADLMGAKLKVIVDGFKTTFIVIWELEQKN